MARIVFDRLSVPALTATVLCIASSVLAADASWQLLLRHQRPTSSQAERYHRVERQETWQAAATAVIVCDMWDSHHCFRAVGRVEQLAPRMDRFLAAARNDGAVIIHAPSDCMQAYQEHAARQRAVKTPAVNSYPEDIDRWCHQIPSEEQAEYPIDQSDGGEDDTPEEHAAWVAQLQRQGRDVRRPWKQQIDLLGIDAQRDYISDSGKEIWNILQDRGIEQVMLVGVHTNMCVLGRPFGLRRMVAAEMPVVLVRDLTDTMYNPAARPFVSHFSGTDLIIDHIERHVCPTISSDQLLGGTPLRFADDDRPHVAMLIGESEYETAETLPRFADDQLRKDHRVSFIFAAEQDGNRFPGIELLHEADVLLLSVRRRTPPPEQLEVVRRFVADGKPVIGIRTANHAFHQRGEPAPQGAADWPTLDADVFGGSYTNHHGNDLAVSVEVVAERSEHPILAGVDRRRFPAGGSLYKVSPVASAATVLMLGEVQGHPAEPVAWTYRRAAGGRSFYTSLGAPKDFAGAELPQLLRGALRWAVASPEAASGTP